MEYELAVHIVKQKAHWVRIKIVYKLRFGKMLMLMFLKHMKIKCLYCLERITKLRLLHFAFNQNIIFNNYKQELLPINSKLQLCLLIYF